MRTLQVIVHLLVVKGKDAKHFLFALCWRMITVVWEDQDWTCHNMRSKLSILKLDLPEKKLQEILNV